MQPDRQGPPPKFHGERDILADWADLPQEPLGWMHSGVAVADGHVIVGHPGEPTLLFYDFDGALRRALALEGLLEPHGFLGSWATAL